MRQKSILSILRSALLGWPFNIFDSLRHVPNGILQEIRVLGEEHCFKKRTRQVLQKHLSLEGGTYNPIINVQRP